MQLRIDGGEVTHPPDVHATSAHPWPPSYVAVVKALVRAHLIRSAEIGVIVHALRRERLNRHECGFDYWGNRVGPDYPRGGRFVGCCKFAASDGWSCARRMEKRGIIEHVGVGVWQLAEPAEVAPHDGIRCTLPREAGQ